MSRVTRRKHVLKEMFEEDYELPTEQQQIVRVVSSRGNNLHEVETAPPHENEMFLVSMPTKFRKNVWVKRGDFVLVERIEEGDKVKAEICKILTPEHIKEYTKAGIWPQKFTNKRPHEEDIDEDLDADADEFVVRNRNRPAAPQNESDDEDSDDSDSSGENSIVN